jgi:hypothetical protein
MAKPSVYELWLQAGGDNPAAYDRDRFVALMREHGHLLKPGDDGYEDAPKGLPCGWPGRRRTLLDHLDEFCLYCLAGNCGSCEGGPCQCAHEDAATGTEPG